MIHGAFCGGWAMANLASAFVGAGYRPLCPDLRHHRAESGERDLKSLGVTSIKDYAEDIRRLIDALPEKPILVGHSMGGLIAQILAARGLAHALILLAPSAPWGMFPTHWNAIASGFGLYLLNGNYWEQALMPIYDVAAEHTLHRLPASERDEIFERFVPESGRAMFEIIQWWLDLSRATDVPVNGAHCPVFCAVGTEDRVNPPESVKRIAERYRSKAELRHYDKVSHWIVGDPGWQRIAEDIIQWLDVQNSEEQGV